MTIKKEELDQPNPNSGASTAELMMALGKTMDEALDIQIEVEKIAKEEENGN